MMHKAWCSIEEVPYYFSWSSIKFRGHTGWKIDDSNPIWVRLLGRSQLSNPSDLPCYFPNLNFWWMSDSHNVGLIFSALSKSTCGGLVRPVRQIVQPCISLWPLLYFIFLTLRTHSIYQEYCHLDTDLDKCCTYWEKGTQPVMLFSRKQDNVLLMVTWCKAQAEPISHQATSYHWLRTRLTPVH